MCLGYLLENLVYISTAKEVQLVELLLYLMAVCMHTCTCTHSHVYSPIHNFSFKNLFCLFHLPARDYPWILKNKRPEKLRDTLKEVEVCFRTFKNGNRWSGFQTPFNSFNFHQDPTVPVLINALLSGRRFQDRWILVWHTSSVHLKIQSRLTDIGNAYCQLHSLFFVVL